MIYFYASLEIANQLAISDNFQPDESLLLQLPTQWQRIWVESEPTRLD